MGRQYFGGLRRERAAGIAATLSEFKEMGQLGFKPNQWSVDQGAALRKRSS